MAITRHVWKMSIHIFVMQMVLSMAKLHLVGHSNQNEVKHDFFSHMRPLLLALLSCDANCIITGTMLLIRSRQLKQCLTLSCDAASINVSTA